MKFSPVQHIKVPAALLLVTLLFSCRNSKQLIYFKDVYDNEKVSSLQEDTTSYEIKEGDILYVSIKSLDPEINVLFNPESYMEGPNSYNQYQKYTTPQGAYLYGFEVDNDGNVNLPILGAVPVAGNTQKEAEKIIQQYANKYIKDAIVKAKLLNYRITVLGEVKKPGIYYNYNNSITVLEAVALANGNNDFANISKVVVIRPTADGDEVMKLDLTKKESFMSKGFYLHPNDYVFVEPAKNKTLQMNSLAFSLLFSTISMALAILAIWK